MDHRKNVDKEHWTFKLNAVVASYNALYKYEENALQIPGGILQGVLFNSDRPKYMNYGGLGTVIGHQITHGFDNVGRYFDGESKLRNWWETTDIQEYIDN